MMFQIKGQGQFWTLSPVSDWGKKEKVEMSSGLQEKMKQNQNNVSQVQSQNKMGVHWPTVLKLKVQYEDYEKISLIHQEESDLAFCGSGEHVGGRMLREV